MSLFVVVTVAVVLIGTPLALWFSRHAWQIVRDDPGNPLALVLARFLTAVLAGCVLLAIPTVAFVTGHTFPFGGQLVLIAICVIVVSALYVGGYLRWLKGRS